MDCLDDNLIAALCEGSLPDTERAQVEQHLAGCAHCRDLLAVLQGCQVPPTPSPTPSPTPMPTPPASDPLVGQLLSGTYRLLHALGQGGMGKVYAAEHVRLQRRVAVKLLSADLCQHPEVLERFQREARICAGLGSHHIVDVLDFNQLPDGTPYMVMEQLRGEDLAQRLALGGGLLVEQVASVLRQVCAALACTHAEGILHRDLKPSNIFLCEEPGSDELLIKVLDFGISKARGSLATITHTEEILGTPAYMSPEMALAKHRQLDHRADLFSLGAIAYEALSGQRPFSADTIPAVLYRVVNEAPPPPHRLQPEIPRPLSRLVMDLLSKDPARRPASAEEVIRRLDQLGPLRAGRATGRQPLRPSDGAGVLAQAPTAHAEPTPLASGLRARLGPTSWALLVVLILAAAAGLWLSLGDHRERVPTASSHPARAPAASDQPQPGSPPRPSTTAPAAAVQKSDGKHQGLAAPPLTDQHAASPQREAGLPPPSPTQQRPARQRPARERSKPRPLTIDPDPIL